MSSPQAFAFSGPVPVHCSKVASIIPFGTVFRSILYDIVQRLDPTALSNRDASEVFLPSRSAVYLCRDVICGPSALIADNFSNAMHIATDGSLPTDERRASEALRSLSAIGSRRCQIGESQEGS